MHELSLDGKDLKYNYELHSLGLELRGSCTARLTIL